jgi:hypothetical protein
MFRSTKSNLKMEPSARINHTNLVFFLSSLFLFCPRFFSTISPYLEFISLSLESDFLMVKESIKSRFKILSSKSFLFHNSDKFQLCFFLISKSIFFSTT